MPNIILKISTFFSSASINGLCLCDNFHALKHVLKGRRRKHQFPYIIIFKKSMT